MNRNILMPKEDKFKIEKKKKLHFVLNCNCCCCCCFVFIVVVGVGGGGGCFVLFFDSHEKLSRPTCAQSPRR